MRLGILKEHSPETRVSLLPETVAALTKQQVEVYVEQDAGATVWVSDEQYIKEGAKIVSRQEACGCDMVLSINHPSPEDFQYIRKDAVLMGVYHPLYFPERVKQWQSQELSVFSLDFVPRTTRAQSMDVLSSQANIAGYKAVLLAATTFGRYFPMFMTAAGSIPPAKVLILGAGVAGLQAIATAKRLGAVVEVFDTRPSVKEEVQSLGAKFVEVEGASDASKAGGYAVMQTAEYQEKQKNKIAEHVAKNDIIITTAQIPGKLAPILITTDMIKSMKQGSVIIDLAAATGGNTDVTKNNETIIHEGAVIIGNSNLQASMPLDASRMYGKNILNFSKLIINNATLHLNFEDDIVKGTCITHAGNIVNERVAVLFNV